MSFIRFSRRHHLACSVCMDKLFKLIQPADYAPVAELLMDGTERCCWCGKLKTIGYFLVRRDPALVRCKGIHK